jgi:hypothetical protein
MVFTTVIKWKEELPYIKEQGNLGKTMVDLSKHYGVSRQRMKQIIDKFFPNWKYDSGFAVKRKQKAEDHYQKWGDKDNSVLYKSQRAKFRSKKYNIERIGGIWDIDFGDLEWPTHCPALGIELNYFNEFRAENSPSFDQVIPGKGYVKGNVKIISLRANRIKNDGTKEELMKIVEWLNSVS